MVWASRALGRGWGPGRELWIEAAFSAGLRSAPLDGDKVAQTLLRWREVVLGSLEVQAS